jgi:hypothetical protein
MTQTSSELDWQRAVGYAIPSFLRGNGAGLAHFTPVTLRTLARRLSILHFELKTNDPRAAHAGVKSGLKPLPYSTNLVDSDASVGFARCNDRLKTRISLIARRANNGVQLPCTTTGSLGRYFRATFFG